MTEDKRAISPPLPSDPSPTQNYPIPHMPLPRDSPAHSERPQEKATSPRAAVTSVASETMPPLSRSDSKRASNDSSKMRPPRPMSDVVTEAFQDSLNTSNSNHIDPEMVRLISAQVTEQVMKNLAQQQAAGTNPLTPSQQSSPRSATQSTFDAPPLRSAPSPTDSRRDARNVESPPREYPQPDLRSGFGPRNPDCERSPDTYQGRGASRPTPIKIDPNSQRAQVSASIASPSQRQDSQLDGPPSAKRPGRADSKLPETGYDATPRSSRAKSAGPSVSDEESALERAWQPLFINGKPTPRLSSFLRGLALHIVDDYEPKGSLVITPAKMLRFFNETRVDEEHYPWNTIFSRLTHASLSTLYRKMMCPHHLVQKTYQDPPVIPGLTTWGFEYFMTCLIQAHPDTEFERLAKAVVDMPISSADDRTHRFPRELSRRLFPFEANIQAQQKLVWSMNHEPSVIGDLKGRVAMPPPPASTPPGQPAPQQSLLERQRQPYAQNPQKSSFLEDDDLNSRAIQIERERKPYTAREGAGKTHAGEDTRPPLNQKGTATGGTRHARSNSSVHPQGIYPTGNAPSDPVNIPQRNQHRYAVGPAPMSPSMNGTSSSRQDRGRSSPPPRNPFNNSDPLNVGSMPEQQYMSNLQHTQSHPNTGHYNGDAYRSLPSQYRTDRPPNNMNTPVPLSGDTGGSRGFPIPNRPLTASGAFEYPPGSMGGPVGDAPTYGSFPSRRTTQPPGMADRRRSTLASAKPATGGSDSGVESGGSHTESGGNGGYHAPPPPPMQPYGSSSQY